ncbi:hypothetical protein ACQPZX_06020 [Actinoplanes sp. CA-142083]|uniref:hypothetical protein n=1 Tax=Actinoplanes sp. CA-142083 TaxID=3239903 RepID=UPI003D8EE658
MSTATRVVSVYNLTPQLAPPGDGKSIGSIIDIGTRQRFVEQAAHLLPSVVSTQRIAPDEYCGQLGALFSEVLLIVLQTVRGDTLILIEATAAPSTSTAQLRDYLTFMDASRDHITIGDQRLTERIADVLDVPSSASISVGYFHELVFAGGALADEILAQPTLATATLVVDRELRGPANHPSIFDTRTPEVLNLPGEAVTVHSRRVTVTAGWDRSVQDALTLVVLMVIGAFGVMRRSRDRAFRALKFQAAADTPSIAEARSVLARLAEELSEVQLDLSFGVEAYIDSVLLPGGRMQGYRHSLHDVVGIDAALVNTTRMVDRLVTVIQARSAVLDAAEQEARERRDRILSVLLGVGSTIAVPATLLLAFFSVNSSDVDDQASILDLSRYWPAYALAWIPFLTLLTVAMFLRNRVRTRMPAQTPWVTTGGGPGRTSRTPSGRGTRNGWG